MDEAERRESGVSVGFSVRVVCLLEARFLGGVTFNFVLATTGVAGVFVCVVFVLIGVDLVGVVLVLVGVGVVDAVIFFVCTGSCLDLFGCSTL